MQIDQSVSDACLQIDLKGLEALERLLPYSKTPKSHKGTDAVHPLCCASEMDPAGGPVLAPAFVLPASALSPSTGTKLLLYILLQGGFSSVLGRVLRRKVEG